jgi:hypothetical protein
MSDERKSLEFAESSENYISDVTDSLGLRSLPKWIGAYFESSTTILLIIGGIMYYITYILTVTTCFGFQH